MTSIMLGHTRTCLRLVPLFLFFFSSYTIFAQTGHIEYAVSPIVSSGNFSSSFDISSQDLSPSDLEFSNDGKRMYVIGNGSNTIYQYDLSIPYDLASATPSFNFDVSGKDTSPSGLTFSSTGFQMFLVGSTTDSIYQFNLSIPYELSTAFPLDKGLFVGDQETFPTAVEISPDGTRVLIAGTTSDNVHEYILSNANTVGTGAYSGNSLSLSPTIPVPQGIRFNANGTSLFVTGSSTDRVFEYDLSTPYDITTAIDNFTTLSINSEETSPTGIALDSTGTALFTVGTTQRAVIRYNLTSNAFYELSNNTGELTGEMIISITGDTFVNAGGTLTENTHYTVDNLPPGLTPQISVAADGTTAVLTLSGSAINNDDVNDIEDIQMTFTNAAVSGGNISILSNAVSASSGLRIDFSPDPAREITYFNDPLITSGVESARLDISLIEPNIRDFYMTPDGTRIFLTGNTNRKLTQMDLSVPYDISTATETTEFDLIFDVPSVNTIAFSKDGMRCYVAGISTDAIQEILFEQPYDLSTAYLIGKIFFVASEDTNPESIWWSNDGSRLFMLGNTNDRVFEYSASVAFDTESLSYSGKFFSVSGQSTAPTDMAFNADGSKMYILDFNTNRIFQYNLSTPFDISTAEYSTINFSTADIQISGQGLQLINRGSQLMVTGGNSDALITIDLNTKGYYEKASNEGMLSGEIILNLSGDQFTSAGATLTEGTDYTISNLPAGLTSIVSVSDDGSSANVILDGKANAHDDVDGVSDLQFTFNNSAFADGDAGAISGAIAAGSGFPLNFDQNLATSVSYSPEVLITTANLNSTFDISAIDLTVTALTFSRDGLKMFFAGSNTDNVFEYNLASAFDITTATLQHQLEIGFNENNVGAIHLNPSGTRLYLLGKTSDAVHEYLLQTPFDLSSAAYLGNVLDVSGEELNPEAMHLNEDGTKFFVLGVSSDAVFQYNLEEPFDFSTATYSGFSKTVDSETGSPAGIHFSADGTRMFTIGNGSDRLFTYDLATPFDISTAEFAGISLNFSGFDGIPDDLHINPSGDKLFVIGRSSNTIYSFDLTNDAFTETAANDGTIEGLLKISLQEASFAAPGSTLLQGTDYTIPGLPASLTPQITVADDGKNAFLTLTGALADHDDADDLTGLSINWLSSAFTAAGASTLINATGATFTIDLDTDLAPEIVYSPPIDLASFDLVNTLDISTEDLNPTDVIFSRDGMKFYMLGNTANSIFEYTMSSPFDLLTAAQSAEFNLTFEENTPTGITFNSTGTRLFVVGTLNDQIHEIILETAYDLATAAFSGKVLYVGEEDITPNDLTFSADGNQLFIVGAGNDNVYQYDLGTSFDLSTASFFGKAVNISPQLLGPTDLAFNSIGTRMFVSGNSSDRIFVYNLSTPFDVSTAVYAEISLSLSAIDNNPEGFYLDQTGQRLFLAGNQNDNIYELSTDNFAFREQAANDGSVEGFMTIYPVGDNFSLVSGSLTPGSDYLINNLPAGLTPDLEVFDDGEYAVLTFSGNALANDNSDDIASLNFTFTDAAFSGLAAASFANAVAAESGLGINFTSDPATEITYSLPVLITTANLKNSLDVSGQDLSPTSLTFNNDGTKLYMLGTSGDNIYEYQLTTAYDVSSAILLSQFYVGFEDITGTAITFNNDGTKLFMVGQVTDNVIEYRLREPFDLSTAALTGDRLNVGEEDTSPSDITFSKNGMRMFMVGTTTDIIYQYDLQSPFELTGATYTGVSQNVSSNTVVPSAIEFNRNGTRLFVTGTSSDRVHTYSLPVPFDIATLTDENIRTNLTTVDNSPSDLFIDDTGTRLFVVGQQNDAIFAFDLIDDAFQEKGADDGSVEGELQINITGDTFTFPSGNLTEGTDYSIDNIPAGLTPLLSVSADGTFGILSFSGNATSNDDVDDVNDIVITFSNSAFSGNDAAIIGNAVAGSSNLGIDFTIDEKFLTYSINPDFTTVSRTERFFIGSEEISPTGLTFSNDGSKMYVIGSSTDQIYEYTLSVNYDVSTAVLSSSLSTAQQETSISDIAFNNTGSRLFLMGQNSRRVYEILVDVPFDLSTAAYTGTSFDISNEDTAPSAFTFRPDGLEMFVIGASSDDIYSYSLTTPYDISTASFSGSSLDIVSQFFSATSVSFNTNGTVMYLTGTNNRQLGQYNLTSPYDINTATFAGNMLDFLTDDNSPADFYFEPSGTRLFMLGAAEDSVWTYRFNDLAFEEDAENDGSVNGELLIRLTGGSFTNGGGQLSDFTVDNLPEGLVPEVNVAADGLSAVLTLTGNASEQASLNSVSDLIITFGDGAFTDGNAALYANATSASTGLGLSLFGPLPPTELFVTEVSDTRIDLSWIDQADDEEDYLIYRSDGNNTDFMQIGTVGPDVTFYSDESVTAGNSYFYYVAARNAEGESSPSAQKAGATLTPPGNALAFDGIDDMVSVSSLLAPTDDFTLEAWVKYEGSGVGFETIIEFGDDNPWFGISSGTLTLFGYVIDSRPFIRNIWTHVAVTYNKTTEEMVLFVNGSEVSNGTFTTAFNGSTMGIGHNQGDSFFQGLIDEVRIWTVARTETEIQNTLESELIGNEAGLLAYYKFDQTVSGFDVLPDRSINNYNGELIGFDFGGLNTESDWNTSEALTVTIPGPPVALEATSVTDMQFTANWEFEPGVTDYVIEVGVDEGFTGLIPGFDNVSLGDVNEFPVSGLNYRTDYFYRIRGVIFPGDTTDYSNVIAVTTDVSSGTIADSVALGRLYNELAGEEWFINENWAMADTRIESWFGVTVENNRVTAIDLSSNNLTGSISAFSGEELSQLTTLILSDNNIEDIPDLSGTGNLSDVRLENNFLAFDDLEPNVGIPGIVYSDQNTLLDPVEALFNEGTTAQIDRSIGGSANVYVWTKDGVPVSGGDDGILEISNVTFSDEGSYIATVTSSLVPGLTLVTEPYILTVSSLEKDIQALTNIYNATGGTEWSNDNGWLSDDISTWFGVGITDNRVSSLTLPDNNLTGTLPDDILDILNLEILDLSGNELDSIPALTSLDNLTQVDVSGNLLQFDDLEANIGFETFVYGNQRFAGSKETISQQRGSQLILSELVKGLNNEYQWTLNGSDIAGATSSDYIIDDIGFDDMGNYSLEVTNSLLPDLTLNSPIDSVLATTFVSGTVTGQSGGLEDGEVVFLRIVGNNEAYVPIDSIEFVDGSYTFPDLTLADYLVVINPADDFYIPTYHRSGFLWNEADTVFLRENDQTADVQLVVDPDATSGQAAIAGIFEEEFTEEGREEARRRVRRVGVALRRRRSSGRTDNDDFELIAYTFTDDNGRFSFPNLPAGIYRINFEFPGVPMDENSFVEFEIVEGEEPSNLELEAVATEEGKIVVTDVTEDPVNVRELELPFDVYPNPAASRVTVDFRKLGSSSLEIQILDNTGRKITGIQPENGFTSETIDLSNFEGGMYLIRVFDRKDRKFLGTYRLIKY